MTGGSHDKDNSKAHHETGTEPAKLKQVRLNAHEVRERCKTDLDFFGALMMPGVIVCPFPAYYHMLWQLFTTLEYDYSKVFRFALGLPRGHAKTTFIKLLICYLVLHGKAKFILMVCSTEPHSYNMMDDVDYMLGAKVVRDTWGNWKAGLVRDTKGLKRGNFNNQSIVLAALGSGTSIRGLNVLNTRPDVIIMDDIQTKECAKSQTENAALMEWMTGTLLKARDAQKALLVYIGNMYNEECILNQLKLHSQWQSFITGAILEDWTPLWPELFTVEQLLAEYQHDNKLGLGDIWFSEVMNIPIGGKLSLLPEGKIPETPILDVEDPIGGFITIDPSGYRKDSDDTGIAVHLIYAPNHYQVRDIVSKVLNPGETIAEAFRLADQYDIKHIFVETVAYQQSLQWHLQETVKSLPAHMQDISILELKTGRRNKTSRIRLWIKTLLEGAYSLHKDVRDAVMFQALGFKIERTDNKDDILDVCAYGMDVRTNYADIIIDKWANQEQPTTAKLARVRADNSFLD